MQSALEREFEIAIIGADIEGLRQVRVAPRAVGKGSGVIVDRGIVGNALARRFGEIGENRVDGMLEFRGGNLHTIDAGCDRAVIGAAQASNQERAQRSQGRVSHSNIFCFRTARLTVM